VHRVIAGGLANQAGVDRASAECGTVTLIQRFGSALNLNIHFHLLWLDGVYEPVAAPPGQAAPASRPRADLRAVDAAGRHHRAPGMPASNLPGL